MGLTTNLAILLTLTAASLALNNKNRKIMDDLFKDYNKDQAPSEPDVTNVQVGVYVDAMWLNEDDQELKLRMIMRESWTDERLKVNFDGTQFVVVPKDLENKFWVPDFYFKTTLNLERFNEPHDQRLMRLYDSGRIWRATAYTVGLLCQMNLAYYPSDSQSCRFDVESFTMNADHTNITQMEIPSPIQLREGALASQEWILYENDTEDCSTRYSTGSYSCVGFKFIFQRDAGRYHRQSHVPFILLLLVAYVSYFLSRKNPFLRFGYLFLVGLLLIAAAFNVHMTSSHPNVPYVTVADVWEGVCFFLYFCVVLHSLLVLSLEAKGRKGDEPGPYAFRAQQLDRIGMAAYPIALALWVIVYFAAF